MLGVALAGIAAGGVAQSVTGLGFALIAAPGLIALLGPPRGVALVVILGTLVSALALIGQWRVVRVRDGASLLVPTLVATPLVAVLIDGLDARVLAAAAGLAVLLGVAALWRGGRWPRLVSTPGAIGSGVASALLNVVGGVGGPPVALYAANADWPPDQTRSTLQAFFLVQGVVTAAVIGFVLPSVPMLLALVAGTGLGIWLAPRIPPEMARHAALAVAGFGGLALVLGSV